MEVIKTIDEIAPEKWWARLSQVEADGAYVCLVSGKIRDSNFIPVQISMRSDVPGTIDWDYKNEWDRAWNVDEERITFTREELDKRFGGLSSHGPEPAGD